MLSGKYIDLKKLCIKSKYVYILDFYTQILFSSKNTWNLKIFSHHLIFYLAVSFPMFTLLGLKCFSNEGRTDLLFLWNQQISPPPPCPPPFIFWSRMDPIWWESKYILIYDVCIFMYIRIINPWIHRIWDYPY